MRMLTKGYWGLLTFTIVLFVAFCAHRLGAADHRDFEGVLQHLQTVDLSRGDRSADQGDCAMMGDLR